MNLFTLASLSVGISCLLLSAIALYFGKTKLHRLLLFFNLAVTAWGIGLFLVGISNSVAEAKLAWKFAQCVGLFIAPAFFHLTCAWCEIRHQKLLYLAYGQALFFAIACIFTDLIINEFRYIWGIYFIKANLIYTSALLLYLFFVILSYSELIKFFKHQEDH
jgi:hypothetical protein